MSIIFLNGEFVAQEKAAIPIKDRGFLFGDGIFTTLLVKEGVIECCKAHLLRLTEQCRQIHITPPTIHQENLRELVLRNDALKGSWRLKIIVTGGLLSELNLASRPVGQVLITLDPFNDKLSSKPYRLTLFPEPLSCPSAKLKSLAYLDRLMIKDYARLRDFDDAIATTSEGWLLETAFSNLFWRHQNTLFTPDPSLPLFYGTSMEIVKEAANTLNLHFHHIQATFNDIPPHSQVFACNSLRGLIPIHSIEGTFFERDRPFEHSFLQAYHKLIAKSSFSCNL